MAGRDQLPVVVDEHRLRHRHVRPRSRSAAGWRSSRTGTGRRRCARRASIIAAPPKSPERRITTRNVSAASDQRSRRRRDQADRHGPRWTRVAARCPRGAHPVLEPIVRVIARDACDNVLRGSCRCGCQAPVVHPNGAMPPRAIAGLLRGGSLRRSEPPTELEGRSHGRDRPRRLRSDRVPRQSIQRRDHPRARRPRRGWDDPPHRCRVRQQGGGR